MSRAHRDVTGRASCGPGCPASGTAARCEGVVRFGPAGTIHRSRWPNGLRLLVHEDHAAPVVSFQSWLDVGSRHEQPGKTGLAHLFEHLMFNEAEGMPPGTFDRRIEAMGGQTNAATWTDWTYYHDEVPADALEELLELEARRFARLVLHAPQVRCEKDVVANERRLRVEDDVDGTMGELLWATAFRRHPYRWPTIGWMEDIRRFTVADARRFYRTFYVPERLVLVVAGAVDPRTLHAQVDARYGRLRARRREATATVREPAQRGERRVERTLPTEVERLAIGWRAPAYPDPRWVPLDVTLDLLAGGRSSRLHRRLVEEEEVATSVRGSLAPFRDPGLLELWVTLRPGRSAEEALALLDEEVARLLQEGPSHEELEKSTARLELGLLSQMLTVEGRAEEIGFHEIVTGRPDWPWRRLQRARRLRPERLLRVARAALRPSARTVVGARPLACEEASA